MEPQHHSTRPSSVAQRRVFWSAVVTFFAVSGIALGCLLYASMRDLTLYGNLPLLAAPAYAAVAQWSDPTAVPEAAQPPPQRMNILLLGIDARENTSGPSRTDSMMLCSIDPISKTVTLLSIPRDLWVPMPPGFVYVGQDRINAAHLYGDLYHYPGGGPALAKETVQYNLGVPVQYYVRVDFHGFVRIIDEIGGIDVDVPRDIVDMAYPVGNDQVTTLHIHAGLQHMDGDLALKYARTRHDSSDIDRARRQQQVMLAIRGKALSLDIPLTRIPGLLSVLGDSVQTDMPLDRIYQAAQVVRTVRADSIRRAVIDETMTTRWMTSGGADVLLPQPDKIHALVDELFAARVGQEQCSPGPAPARDGESPD